MSKINLRLCDWATEDWLEMKVNPSEWAFGRTPATDVGPAILWFWKHPEKDYVQPLTKAVVDSAYTTRDGHAVIKPENVETARAFGFHVKLGVDPTEEKEDS